jgi:hypothetical protein
MYGDAWWLQSLSADTAAGWNDATTLLLKFERHFFFDIPHRFSHPSNPIVSTLSADSLDPNALRKQVEMQSREIQRLQGAPRNVNQRLPAAKQPANLCRLPCFKHFPPEF